MRNKLNLFLIFLFSFIFYLHVNLISQIPAPFVNSINVISGQCAERLSSTFKVEYYTAGINEVGNIIIQLPKGDFRIGRVKLQRAQLEDQSWEITARFFYFPDYTEVLNNLNQKNIYRYSAAKCLTAVEHYSSAANGYQLYRKERLFWTSQTNNPQLLTRVLEDAQGKACVCCAFQYNPSGQVIKETLYGNLSGNCAEPLIIQSSGYPLDNGIEHYSISYQYSTKEPSLLLRQQEDNGRMISYQYDPVTQQCTAKLIGDQKGLLIRYFYFYDQQGFLNQTFIDDGQGTNWQDLTQMSYRQILTIQSRQQEPAIGQPLVTESQYLDLRTQTKLPLEKIVSTYSAQGELIQQDFYDANNSLRYDLKMTYNEQGKLLTTVDSRGEIAEDTTDFPKSRYNNLKQEIGLIDQYGNETEYFYDDWGRLIKTLFPLVLDENERSIRPAIKQEYDIQDRVIKHIDAKGQVTQTIYNVRGKPIEIRYPDGSSESFTYFLDGNLKSQTAKNGLRTCFERDRFGRMLSMEEYATDGTCLNALFYTYKGSQLITVSDGQSVTVHFQYDEAGRPIGSFRETQDGTQRLEWDYDECGQKKSIKEWFGPGKQDFIVKIQKQDAWQNPVEIGFEDAQGQVQKKIELPKEQTEHDFFFTQDRTILNDRNQYVRQQEKIDGYGGRQLVTYDALGRIECVTHLDPFGIKLKDFQIRYDANGNKVIEKHLVVANGVSTRFFVIAWHYDALNRVVGIVEGLGSPQQKHTYYRYNVLGQLEAVIKPDGTTLLHSYDTQGRLISFKASDHSFDYRYTYDAKGRLISVVDLIHGTSVQRHYDAFNQIIEEKIGSFSFKNQYDLAGRRVQLTLPDYSHITYQYEGLNLKKIERLSPNRTHLYQHEYHYNEESNSPTSSQLIGHLGTLSYEKDAKGQIACISSPWWSETIPQDGYDAYQRLIHYSIQDPLGQISHRFTYTDDHQLSSEAGFVNHEYTYDSLYNRIQSDQQPWLINEANQLIQTSDVIYSYDENGNLLQKKEENSTWNYHYDALNRLTRVEKDQKAIEYQYDAFHRRLVQIFYTWNPSQSAWELKNVHFFLYDGSKEIGRLDANGNMVELRVLGIGKGAEIGAAVALELQDQLYAPICDQQGSIRCLIDAKTHRVAEFYRYSAYGIEEIFDANGYLLDSSLIGNPWRFASKRQDPETGLLFFGKRYYDPKTGRWITPDPLFFYDTPNLYTFVQNNPLTHYDLYGLFSISAIWNKILTSAYNYLRYVAVASHQFPKNLYDELKLDLNLSKTIEQITGKFISESMFLLMGYHFEETEAGTYGQREISDKVRVTFINGILTTQAQLVENLELISQSHGGINIHYIFRPTEGWVWDITRGLMIKVAYALGFRSLHAYMLADMWKSLIADMGGVDEGGMILHYAHSLGGSDTDRARMLLTPEEQKMIRVISMGSATMIRNQGFESVINYVSLNDGVSYLDPLGRIRNLFDSKRNIIYKSRLGWIPFCDHVLSGCTYKPIVEQLGEQFIKEFSSI